VVYEVVDSNTAVQEGAQIPTFVGFTAGTAHWILWRRRISFAPISTVTIADMTSYVPPLRCGHAAGSIAP